MTIQVNIAEAKAKLSALVEAALRGEEVVLARGGEPVARIVSLSPASARRPNLLAQLGYPDVDEASFDPEPEIAAAIATPLEPGQRR
ncbi:MAG: type II toxin-antitoxin system prevent-host-death family antitoxin [Terricaulis sp.]